MDSFFKVIYQDKKTKARTGVLKTTHGLVQTPVFVPVGTKGTVKSLTPQDLKDLGFQIFLANTYHLYLRPGPEIIEKLGGLHKFTGWRRGLMTDSGGFQVFSLGASQLLVKIEDDGVTFRSHLDGSLHRFTPEKSIEIQQKLGADIILAFDDCPSYGAEKEKVRKSLSRTHDWALRSLTATQGKPSKLKQLLFGIVQGGVFEDLREESAKFISGLPFDGVAIGGVAVGESKSEMYRVLDWVIPHLSAEKPRHLLGVGEIDDIFQGVERGIDMFDCVMPTRLGRMGHLLVKNETLRLRPAPSGAGLHSGQELKVKNFAMDVTKAIFTDDPRPIMDSCQCYVCQNFSRAYLNHLFRARELLAYRLATYHNLYFMADLMRQIREAIVKKQFKQLKKRWLLGYN